MKVMVLPVVHVPPQPRALMVKKGALMDGLLGAKSVETVPVPTKPEFAPDTEKLVALVNVRVHVSSTVPTLLSTGGDVLSL